MKQKQVITDKGNFVQISETRLRLSVYKEAWYAEAEDEDLGSSDLRVWENQLRDIVSESQTLPVPDDPALEDDLFSLQREAEEAWQHIQDMLTEYPEKIRDMMNEIARIRAGRMVRANSSGLPGTNEAWDAAEISEEIWHSRIEDDED